MNAQEIIMEIGKLTQEEKQVVIDFAVSISEETYKETDYSLENMAKIDHDIEEAERGENTVGPFRGKEAVNYLKKLRQA